MFGEMLGLWCVQVWHDQGQPETYAAGGAGPRARHLDGRCLARREGGAGIPAGLEVVLVEASPVLQDAQAEKLKDSGAAIRWKAHFDDTLGDRPLFLLANEFFDALPVRQYVKTERGWCERMVVAKDGALAFRAGAGGDARLRHSGRAARRASGRRL